MVNLESIHLRIFCFAHASIVMVKVWLDILKRRFIQFRL